MTLIVSSGITEPSNTTALSCESDKRGSQGGFSQIGCHFQSNLPFWSRVSMTEGGIHLGELGLMWGQSNSDAPILSQLLHDTRDNGIKSKHPITISLMRYVRIFQFLTILLMLEFLLIVRVRPLKRKTSTAVPAFISTTGKTCSAICR